MSNFLQETYFTGTTTWTNSTFALRQQGISMEGCGLESGSIIDCVLLLEMNKVLSWFQIQQLNNCLGKESLKSLSNDYVYHMTTFRRQQQKGPQLTLTCIDRILTTANSKIRDSVFELCVMSEVTDIFVQKAYY